MVMVATLDHGPLQGELACSPSLNLARTRGLVLGALSQPAHRVGGGAGIRVAFGGGVAGLVREEVLTGRCPGHPIIGGSFAGRVPRYDQLARIGAGQAQVGDGAWVVLGLGLEIQFQSGYGLCKGLSRQLTLLRQTCHKGFATE